MVGNTRYFHPQSQENRANILAIHDINKNGVPEVSAEANGCTGSRCFRIYTFEWNGRTFVDRSPGIEFWGPRVIDFKDTDNNGTEEITIYGGHPGRCCEIWAIPWRLYTMIYEWNGREFTQTRFDYDPPEYRFQTIQDADQASLKKDYERAMTLYQDTIFSDRLEWWSNERRDYETEPFRFALPENAFRPTPLPDSTEYPRLAAYAYYRMIVLHIHLGETEAATIKYATLQEEFPVGNPGHPYVKMASAFWDAYQSSQNVSTACDGAVQYAAEYDDILSVLGSHYHGDQSLTYEPEDVCPFR